MRRGEFSEASTKLSQGIREDLQGTRDLRAEKILRSRCCIQALRLRLLENKNVIELRGQVVSKLHLDESTLKSDRLGSLTSKCDESSGVKWNPNQESLRSTSEATKPSSSFRFISILDQG